MGILSTIGKVVAAVITVARFVPGPWQVIANVLGTTLSSAIFAVSATATLGYAQRLLGPKIAPATLGRLSPSMNPIESRKIALGQTALNLDVRYWEAGGTNQEYIDYIIATSAHQIESIDQLWFESRLVWTLTGGVVPDYSAYLSVTPRLVGTSSNYILINGGTKWGSTTTLTGCSYLHLRIKRTGTNSKVESPLASGLPSGVRVVGKGALIYDVRLDSTVSGGSGPMRATDQATWGTANSTNRDNTALQLLWFLLGWKINGKLSVGCGIPPSRIDLPSFIAAANICDQAITLADGGTQARYRTAGVASDAEDRMDVIQALLTSMNASLRDSGGRLSLVCMINDLASPVLTFDDNDILGDFQWDQTRGLDGTFNVLHGRYTDASNDGLYQLVEYPSVQVTSVDGLERMQPLDLPWIYDGNRAQRVAKQALQRGQYKGIFTAPYSLKALGCKVGDIVTQTWAPLGWVNKPFRILSQGISVSGIISLTMIEENAAIYAWDRSEKAIVTPTAPTIYNPLNSPFVLGITQSGTTANWSGVSDDNGNKPDDNATVGAPAGTDVGSMSATDISARVTAAVSAAGKINATSITDNLITTPMLAANSITASKLAAGELITTSAQVANGIIINAKIGNLEVDSAKIANLTVGTGKIAASAVTVPVTYSAANLWVTNTLDTIVVEMPTFLAVGDASGGGFIAVFYGTFKYDIYDTGVKLKIWADTGSGYSVVGTQIVGVPVSGGNSAAVIPVAVSYSVSGISQIKLMVTAAQYKIGTIGVYGYSYINDGKLVVMGGKR